MTLALGIEVAGLLLIRTIRADATRPSCTHGQVRNAAYTLPIQKGLSALHSSLYSDICREPTGLEITVCGVVTTSVIIIRPKRNK
jgi:hypothetical protein